MPQKLVLVVVDGMTPAAFERAVESGRAPALAYLAEHGDYRQATSVFPSLTPGLPHVDRDRRRAGRPPHPVARLVEPAGAADRRVRLLLRRAARRPGSRRRLIDTIFNMNERHLSHDAMTVYEALEDAGFVAGAVNITCYRGRQRYLPTAAGAEACRATGRSRFFFYGLFESDRTGAPFAVRSRRAGSVDAYAAGGRALARDARRLRLPRLLPLGLRLRLARGRPGRRGGRPRARAGRRGDRRAPRRGGRAGRVPRALRRRAPLRSRPDAGRAGGAAAGAVRGPRRSRSSSRRRTGPGRSTSCPARASTRPSSRSGSTASRRSTSRSAARATRSSPAATARTSRSRSWSIPTPPGAHARRSRTRTPASCSSRRRRAGSSPTSAAATTRAAAATARSSPATRSCRS